jgi:formylglycine-generating enzyme required for sulfatase activity
MSRTVTVALLITLVAIASVPLVAQVDPKAAQRKRVAEAKEKFQEAEEAYKEILREIEHDFKVVRGEHWPKIAPKFETAIEMEVEFLREDPEHDLVEGLGERFFDISAVCEVTYTRLVAAMEKPIREAAKAEGEVDSAAILAAGLKVVFPEEKFADCWDNHFMNLPQIAAYDKAEAELEAAEKALAEPLLPALPECDGPEGTVYVPKGRFTFGPWTGWEFDIKKNKASKKRAKPFYIDAFEVTNEQYREFLKGLKDADRIKAHLPTDFRLRTDGTITIPRGSKLHPVTGITLSSAMAFAAARGMRLPTEEEWEYAARGGDARLYPWGAEFKKDYANSSERGFGGKRRVGSHIKDKSPFGAYDMAGNVSEMTSDLEGRKPARGNFKKEDAFVWRGGNYEEDRESLRTTYRWTLRASDGRADAVGFRCVVSEDAWKAKKK